MVIAVRLAKKPLFTQNCRNRKSASLALSRTNGGSDGAGDRRPTSRDRPWLGRPSCVSGGVHGQHDTNGDAQSPLRTVDDRSGFGLDRAAGHALGQQHGAASLARPVPERGACFPERAVVLWCREASVISWRTRRAVEPSPRSRIREASRGAAPPWQDAGHAVSADRLHDQRGLRA